ncbi:MAG: hypothetical protein M1831_005097 [Alyxoria varia]|nr:MAG: hypothetical protein M1831_005097 [Alyxoria varia]
MATHATTGGHLPRPTDSARPPKRDLFSRLPSAATTTTPKHPQDPQMSPKIVTRPPGYNDIAMPPRESGKPQGQRNGEAKATKALLAAPQFERRLKDEASRNIIDLDARTPTPSLVSGSSASTQESPRPRVLRRKPSVIGKYVSQKQNVPQAVSSNQIPGDDEEGGTFKHKFEHGRNIPDIPPIQTDFNQRHPRQSPFTSPAPFAHVYAHSRPSTEEPSASRTTPLSEMSGPSSVMASDSPGAFSHATAATSMTSLSPPVSESPRSISQSLSASAKYRQGRLKQVSGGLDRPKIPEPLSLASKGSTTDAAPNTKQSHAGVKGQSKCSVPPSPVCPPELAHLMQEPPGSTMARAGSAPRRPSRDGTSCLADAQKSPTIVQSNLPKLDHARHRRQSSTNSQPQRTTQDVHGSSLPRQSSRQSSRSRASPVPPSPTRPDAGHRPMTPATHTKSSESSAIGASPEQKSKSRFGFFTRRAKAEADASAQNGQKQPRKGPTAGTGHEGYGRYTGRAGNSSSTSVNSAPARTNSGSGDRPGMAKRKSSGASSKKSDLDEFLQQRLSPVYIRGDGSATDSQPRTSGSAMEDETPSTSQTSHSSLEGPITRVGPPKDSTPASADLMDATAVRGREFNKEDQPTPRARSNSQGRRRLAKPRVPPKSSTPNSSQQPSEASAVAPKPSSSSEKTRANETSPQPTDPNGAKNKKSSWALFPKNFFSRSKSTEPEQEMQPKQQSGNPTCIPLAHYTLLDDEPVDMEDLERIMREADAAFGDDDASSAYTTFEDTASVADNQNRRSSLAGSSDDAKVYPNVTPAPNISTERSQEDEPKNAASDNTIPHAVSHHPVPPPSGRSRLPQVGRIPKVVSTQDQPQKRPNQSFSRPFANDQPRPSLSPPSPAKFSTFSMSPPLNEMTASCDSSRSSLNKFPPSAFRQGNLNTPSPFLDFGRRKNSDQSYSSSNGTMYYPTASAMAVAPSPSPDEVWKEYDDLIDDVLTPESPNGNKERGASQGQIVNADARPRTAKPRAGGRTMFPNLSNPDEFVRPDTAPPRADPTKTLGLPKMPEEASTLTPVSSFVAAYTERNSTASQARSSLTKSDRGSTGTNKSRSSQGRGSFPLTHKRSASLPENATNVKDALHEPGNTMSTRLSLNGPSMAIFRSRVLVTSKWLSFGRVLFSPAHNDVGANYDDRVLIVDGLGKGKSLAHLKSLNKIQLTFHPIDWSYYCAETYKDAQIYSLGPSASSNSSTRHSLGNCASPPNHRHFSHSSLEHDFPFPKSFFSVVVLRFPLAATEAALRSAINECKRVLRPGGYLEMSSIDLDLTNMGNCARRAVRALKMRMQATDPEVSLKPASDLLQNLAGRRGFENLNRCIVGVPVSGAVASSRENSSQQGTEGQNCNGLAAGADNFSEMMSRDGAEGDDHITKLVAQVGRWWYTNCYEAGPGVLPDGDWNKSMWADRELLREAEELGTTFKLLIAYAQKPSMVKRRTVSL